MFNGNGHNGSGLRRRESRIWLLREHRLGARLAELANSGIRKRLGDVVGTLFPDPSVARYRPRDLQVNLDGQARVVSDAFNVAVGKTFYIASGLKVRNELTPDDRRLYVLCVRGLS